MAKVFNVTAVCKPEKNYMVDLSGRLKSIKQLVDDGKYFSIIKARQYGKTTILRALANYLRIDYIVVFMDSRPLVLKSLPTRTFFLWHLLLPLIIILDELTKMKTMIFTIVWRF